jgi:hypothetical protein
MGEDSDMSNSVNLETIASGSDLRSIEEQFILLQRWLLAPIIGKESAATAIDYFASGGPVGMFETILSTKVVVKYTFITQAIFGEKVPRRMHKYLLQVGDDEEETEESKIGKEIAKEAFFSFEERVLYADHIVPFRASEIRDDLLADGKTDTNSSTTEEREYNFAILYKDQLTDEEVNEAFARAKAVQKVLVYSSNHYHRLQKETTMRIFDPWKELRQEIEAIILRLAPGEPTLFSGRGVIEGWNNSDYYNPSGYYIKLNPKQDEDGYVGPDKLVLENMTDKERYKHIIGKSIIYQKTNNEIYFCETGKAIALGEPTVIKKEQNH